MPNDENKIILEFPATNVEIELGETITFDNISGFLDAERVTVDGDSLTEKLSAMDSEIGEKANADDVYDKTYIDNAFTGVNNSLNTKMNKTNPTGTGSFSFNRREGSTVGDKSVALGDRTIASGANSFTSGYGSVASGAKSTAMGSGNRASGNSSMAINSSNTASGDYSLAQGGLCEATEYCSHAEGYSAKASGYVSHAEGQGTIANHISQHASGEFNIPDDSSAPDYSRGKYVEIVGNGTSDNNRSNARTLDWNGNETLAGDLIINGNQSVSGEITRLDGRITNLPEAMVFKGTLGVNGDIQTLPTASAEIEGWTFKCITAGTYAGLTLKVGDSVTCFNPPNTSVYEWDISGYGDTDTDTWRAIKVEGVEKLGNGISSGAVDFVGSDNIEVEFDANGNKVGIKTKNIYTESEVDALLDDKADKEDTYTKAQVDDIVYGILPDDTASGSVANFNTSLELPIKSLEVDVNAVQSAGTPTPATPLPISGWSEISLVHCGANLCNQADIVGTYPTKYTVDTDGSIKTVGNLGLADVLWTNKSKVSGALNVIFVSKYQNTGSVGIRPKIIYTDGTNSVIYTTNTQDYSTKTLLTTSSKTVDKIVVDYGTNNPTNFFLEVTLDTSASTYEPYNGNTEVIDLGGTYYGGHFTQDKDGHRQFEVTSSIVTLDASKNWAKNNAIVASNAYTCGEQFPDYKRENGLCSHFAVVSSVSATSGIFFGGGVNILTPLDMGLDNADKFKEWITNNIVQVVYSIAQPIIIDLPDGEPINTLAGVNNFFADTGDSTVVYKCSVNEYVNAHSGGGLLGMGGVYLGGAKSGGGEEEPDEGEDTEKVKLDDPKEEIKTIGDTKKLGGE